MPFQEHKFKILGKKSIKKGAKQIPCLPVMWPSIFTDRNNTIIFIRH